MERLYTVLDEKRRLYKEGTGKNKEPFYTDDKMKAKEKRDNLKNEHKKVFYVSAGPDHPKKS